MTFSEFIENFQPKIKETTMYFLRNTSNPQADLKRGWSCHVNSWKLSREDAENWQKKNGALRKPLQDPYSKKWCADPEIGLSSFAFSDKETFDWAMKHVKAYSYTENSIAVFKSNKYQLGVGLDGEDIFENGKFLFYIPLNCNWNNFNKFLAIAR